MGLGTTMEISTPKNLMKMRYLKIQLQKKKLMMLRKSLRRQVPSRQKLLLLRKKMPPRV